MLTEAIVNPGSFDHFKEQHRQESLSVLSEEQIEAEYSAALAAYQAEIAKLTGQSIIKIHNPEFVDINPAG
jgi:hypothetical protein